MSPHNPIEFVRRFTSGRTQLAGNRVQIEDLNGLAYGPLNPLPTGGVVYIGSTVGIDQLNAHANEVVIKTDPSGTGAYTTPTHTAPSAGVNTGVILAANANRLYALFVNDSDTTVYLGLGVSAAAHTGIRLNANGGSYEMSKKLGNLYLGVVNGISGVANKVVCVTEGV